MKRFFALFFCIAALLSLSVVPTAADSAAAENLTDRCTFDFGTDRDAGYILLKDPKNYRVFPPQSAFSMTWEDLPDGARLCLQWQTVPDGVRVLQYDANGTMLSEETLPAYYETVTPLLPDARTATVQAGEEHMRLLTLAVYGEGELPDPFHAWQDVPDHLDYLLIAAHPDDDVLYLGSVIPTFGAQQGYTGTVIYVTASTRERVSEAQNGAWAMGLKIRPVFFGMPDIGRYPTKQQKQVFSEDVLLLNIVRAYRSMRPLVVFSQDLKGEYGHWQHKLVAKAARKAFALAADPDYDPESVGTYGVWQVQKLFLHLYKENPLWIEAHEPLDAFDGKDAFEVAKAAFKKHASQQKYHFRVTRDNKKYAFNRFGMAEGVVPVGTDVFDGIDETLLSGYVPPTPEPTEAPEPEPTAVPDRTESPAASVPHATAQGETPVQARTGDPFDPNPLYRFAAIVGISAVLAGIAGYVFSRLWIRRSQSEKKTEAKRKDD